MQTWLKPSGSRISPSSPPRGEGIIVEPDAEFLEESKNSFEPKI